MSGPLLASIAATLGGGPPPPPSPGEGKKDGEPEPEGGNGSAAGKVGTLDGSN